jgi:large-conductance mechanosensitive channel
MVIVNENKKQELERKIAEVQRSTRSVIPPLIPWHNWMRSRFTWYYNLSWQLQKMKIGFGDLFSFLFLLFIIGAVIVFIIITVVYFS